MSKLHMVLLTSAQLKILESIGAVVGNDPDYWGPGQLYSTREGRTLGEALKALRAAPKVEVPCGFTKVEAEALSVAAKTGDYEVNESYSGVGDHRGAARFDRALETALAKLEG